MFGFLKKDYNRHFSYNVAVTFFRIAAVFLVLTLCAGAWRLTYSPPLLTPDGVHSYTVKELKKNVYHTRRGTSVTYWAICDDEEGGYHNQTITETEYNALEDGNTYHCPSYISEGGGYFISFGYIKDTAEATKEYYTRFPDQHMTARNIVVIILLGITLVNVFIGAAQLRREKKFKEETEIFRNGGV